MNVDISIPIGILGLAAFIFGRPVIRLLGSAATVGFFVGYINPAKYQSLFADLGIPTTVFNFLKDLHAVCAPYSAWLLEQVKAFF